jgi:pimeloyl-ACP methyl ester carboxylesterase
MQLLLIHGMGRTAFSMRRLARQLRRPGQPVNVVAYMAAFETFDRIVNRVRQQLAALSARGTYAVIGHSLGGLLARAALAGASGSFALPAHLIMLGSPNQPPRLAGRYRRLWPYRWINGECGQLLAQPGFFASLPPLLVPYTIIAGTGERHGRWAAFGADQNDGVVAVSETLVSPTDQPLTFPVRHTFMMNDPRVRRAIVEVIARVEA